MKKVWTLQQEEILRRLYPDCSTATLVNIFHKDVVSIGSKANRMGIKKSEGYMKSPLSGRISKQNDIGLDTRFKALQPGWNKGMKQQDYMSSEAIEKTAKTRFKKGQDPHNTTVIGHERISKDGYIEIKVRHLKNGDANNKNFEFKHRIIYEENFGPIPEGMIVEFKDGDKLNFTPDNLILKTRKENLLNNTMCDSSIVKRFLKVKNQDFVDKIITEMPELIEQKRQTIKLNQKINKEYVRDCK